MLTSKKSKKLKYLKPYTGFEIIKIILFKIGFIKRNKVDMLIDCYNLTSELISKNIDVIKIESHSIQFCFNLNGSDYTVCLKKYSSDIHVFRQVILNEQYQILIDLLKKLKLDSELSIFDIGSNIGMTTIYLKSYFPNSVIHAFEPNPDTYDRLVHNCKELNMLGNLQLNKLGIWDEDTKLSGTNAIGDKQDWAFSLSKDKDYSKNIISCVHLNSYLRSNHIKKVNCIKIDIEGGERVVISRKTDLAWLSEVDILVIEIHDEFNCRNEIESILSEKGFNLMNIGELTIGFKN